MAFLSINLLISVLGKGVIQLSTLRQPHNCVKSTSISPITEQSSPHSFFSLLGGDHNVKLFNGDFWLPVQCSGSGLVTNYGEWLKTTCGGQQTHVGNALHVHLIICVAPPPT